MEVIVDVVGFIGIWLLFSFPLYQGCMELTAQSIYFSTKVTTILHVTKVSPWYWLFPPLKVYLEKKRVLQAIRLHDIEAKIAHKLILYFDKATAWFYVSLAGLLNGVYFTFDLGRTYGWLPSWTWFLIGSTILIGILNVSYRLSPKRFEKKAQQLLEIKKDREP